MNIFEDLIEPFNEFYSFEQIDNELNINNN